MRRGLSVERRARPGRPAARRRIVAAERVVRSLARLERGQPIALPVLRRSRRGDGRRPRARRRTGSDRAVGPGPARVRGNALEAAALADRRAAQPAGRRRDQARDRRPGRGGLVQAAAQDRRAGARRRGVRGRARRHPHRPRQARPRASTCRRRRRRSSPRRRLAAARTAPLVRAHGGGRALDRRRAGDGDHRRRRQLLHDLRRHPEPAAQRRARRAADRRRADRAGQDVLLQRHDRRAHGREGLRGGAGDHQRRAPDRARRRHLPGLDDRLQRGLRGGPRRSTSGRTTRSTSRTTRSGATRRSTIPISTSSSRTTPTTGCCCGRSSAPAR